MTGPELCEAVAKRIMGWTVKELDIVDRITRDEQGSTVAYTLRKWRGRYCWTEKAGFRPDLNFDQYKEVEKKALGESYCIDVCVYHDQINVIIYPTIHIIEPPVMAMEFPRDRFTELHARLETLLDAWRKMKGQDDA